MKYKIGDKINRKRTGEQFEVNQARDFFEAWRTLKDDTKGFARTATSDSDDPVAYHVVYNRITGELYAHEASFEYTDGALYFATETDAKASIEVHKKEWFTLLGIKEKNG